MTGAVSKRSSFFTRPLIVCAAASRRMPAHRSHRQRALLVFVGAICAKALGAQTSTAMARAVETITPSTLARQMVALTTDSLRYRATPSPGLERAAQYVAAELRAAGVRAGFLQYRKDGQGVDTLWTQRYPLPDRVVQLDEAASRIVFWHKPQARGNAVVNEDGELVEREVVVPFTAGARFAVPRVPEGRAGRRQALSAMLVTGRPSATFLREAKLADKTVLYLRPTNLDTAEARVILEALYRASRGVVVIATKDSIGVAASPTNAPQQPLLLADAYLLHEDEEVQPRWAVAIEKNVLAELLAAMRVDLTQAAVAQAPAVRELPELRIWLSQVIDSAALAVPNATAPNVMGLLVGSDPILKYSCIVVTAPLDQRRPRDGDSAAQTASALSLGGLLELARAFRALPARPMHSVLFLATSGGGPDQAFWGSHYYLRKTACQSIMNVTVDLTAGESVGSDTIAIAGLNDLRMTVPPSWMAERHPELRLTVVDGGPVIESGSDATAFSRRAHPSLAIHGNPEVAMEVDQVTRLLQLVFYMSHELAMTPGLPQWTGAARQRVFDRP